MAMGLLMRLWVTLARTLELLVVLAFRRGAISSAVLAVRTKGVDKKLLLSAKGEGLKAFVDGSVVNEGDSCGFAVYYADGHPLNHSARLAPGAGGRADSGLPELAALFWVLLHHPRGQTLAVFSDSEFALRVVQSTSADPIGEQGGGGTTRHRQRLKKSAAVARQPALGAREAAIACAIGWLLRLRSAQTSFFKVAAHKGFRQNHAADALAYRAASRGDDPACELLPLRGSYAELVGLLLRYLLSQSDMDGGLETLERPDDDAYAAPSPREAALAAARAARKPKPTGEPTERPTPTPTPTPTRPRPQP